MRYNVSLILMGLLLLMVLSMLSLTVYYRYTYDHLYDDYDEAVDAVIDMQDELNQSLTEVAEKERLLSTKERILLDYISELNLSKERESTLGEHFTELRGEKEELTENLTEAEQRLADLSDELEDVQDELDVCEVDYRLCEEELDDVAANLPAMKGNFTLLKQDATDAWSDYTEVRERMEQADLEAESLRERVDELENGTEKSAVLDELGDLESDLASMRRSLNDLEENLDAVLDRLQLELRWMTS